VGHRDGGAARAVQGIPEPDRSAAIAGRGATHSLRSSQGAGMTPPRCAQRTAHPRGARASPLPTGPRHFGVHAPPAPRWMAVRGDR
jgi:hypothetical protein